VDLQEKEIEKNKIIIKFLVELGKKPDQVNKDKVTALFKSIAEEDIIWYASHSILR